MAETTPVGAIDINALMAVANSTAVANKNNLALAEQNAKNRKLRDRVANVVRLNTEQSKAISEETENLKAYIEAEAVRQAESEKPNQKVLEVYIKKYNSLLEKQTKIVDTINGLSNGSLDLNAKGKVVSTGKTVPKTPVNLTSPDINISVRRNDGNVSGPSFGSALPTTNEELRKMNAAVALPDSLESQAVVVADNPNAWSSWVSNQVAEWRNQESDAGYKNKWEEIQVLLRQTKRSKGTGPLGLVDDSDLNGLRTAYREAKSGGVYLEFQLEKDYAFRAENGLLAGSPGSSGITKTLTTSLRLLDASDASDKLSNAYYKAYGRYPTQKQITNFKNQWNQEARLQQARGTSFRSKGLNRDITVGEGFTESEKNAFLNRYLVKNLKVDATNLGGDTKKIYDELRTIYRQNFLPEPEFAEVAGVVRDLIGTADTNVYNTKVEQVKQTVRKQAAAFYPSISEALLNGDSVETYASVYRNTLATKWGVTAESLKYDKEAQDLVKAAVNYKGPDNKPRLMDNNEFKSLVQSTNRWKASEEAFTSYSNIGDKLIAAFNLQGGVK
jgi:hypothetical protein